MNDMTMMVTLTLPLSVILTVRVKGEDHMDYVDYPKYLMDPVNPRGGRQGCRREVPPQHGLWAWNGHVGQGLSFLARVHQGKWTCMRPAVRRGWGPSPKEAVE